MTRPDLAMVLVWLAFALCVAAAVPRLAVPIWLSVLFVILALLLRG